MDSKFHSSMLLASSGAREQNGSIVVGPELKSLHLHPIQSSSLSNFFDSSNQIRKYLYYTTQIPMHKHFLSITVLLVSVILGKYSILDT